MNRRKFLRGAAAVSFGPAVFTRTARGAETKLRILIGGAPPDPAAHYLYYAQYNGFYDGIEVSFQAFNSETTATRALVAGEGDVAWTGVLSTIQAMAAGAKVKCITGLTAQTDWVIVANKNIKSMKELEGKTFAASQAGAASETGPRLLLDANKVDTKKVRWVGIGGSSARAQALIAKQIDATALTPGFALQALKYDHLHKIGDLTTDLREFMYCLDMASIKAIETKPEALQAFVTGAARGAKWAMENPEEAASQSAKIMPSVAHELLLAATNAHARLKFYNTDVVLPRTAFDFTYNEAVKLGQASPGINFEKFFHPDFAEVAKKRLLAKS